MNRIAIGSAIALSFVVAFEILIMISPFALVFYDVFNPVLLTLNQWVATRWLTAFFLPHMIVPPNEFLVILRILGSALFVAGAALFLVCAGQIYLGKMLRHGTAMEGLYAAVRHPQYAALSTCALGLVIMWPRFLTLVLFAVMLVLYYVLARDEERRMAAKFGKEYTAYRDRTGMFMPRAIERALSGSANGTARGRRLRIATGMALLCVLILAGGFLARWYTIESLPLQRFGGVDVLCISPVDTATASSLLPPVLADSLVRARLNAVRNDRGARVMAYFLPVDYVMQGMIASTGDEWKLFERHRTIGMITDYIIHPFAHLTAGHAAHMAAMRHDQKMSAMPMMNRRVIFLQIREPGQVLTSAEDDFAINAERRPLFFVDVHMHTAEILQVRDTPSGSEWGSVPTPLF